MIDTNQLHRIRLAGLVRMGIVGSLGHEGRHDRTAIRDRYGLNELPGKATSHAIAARLRPYASMASWYCWRSLDLARNPETVAKGYPS